MLPEFSFPTVMYGIEILLFAFVCALTLMIFRPILLFADFGDITFQRLVGFCPQGAGPVQRQSSYGCPCAAARSVFGNGMGGDCSLRLLLLGSVAIGEGPQERDDGLLLRVRQSELAYLGCVHVFGHFWRRPSRAGNVPRVIEVHDFLERLEVAVVAVGLDEARIRPLVHVAQGGAI